MPEPREFFDFGMASTAFKTVLPNDLPWYEVKIHLQQKLPMVGCEIRLVRSMEKPQVDTCRNQGRGAGGSDTIHVIRSPLRRADLVGYCGPSGFATKPQALHVASQHLPVAFPLQKTSPRMNFGQLHL